MSRLEANLQDNSTSSDEEEEDEDAKVFIRNRIY